MTRRRSAHFATTVSTTLAVVLSTLPIQALANPENGIVVAGAAEITQQAQTTLINQSTDKAIIDWHSFSVASPQSVVFNQPSANSITLNRVTGGDPSNILGTITANGQVWLINPNGIAFGKSARVDVAGLLATTLNIKNADFMAGNYRFEEGGAQPASVTNAGNLTISGAGLAALVAPHVSNSGVIQARLGHIALGSTNGFTLDFYGDGVVNFLLSRDTSAALQAATGSVSNSGSLIADGGTVLLTADTAKTVVDQTINMDGYIQARTIGSQSGRVTLLGGASQTNLSGTIDASGATGGDITVTGGAVDLAASALLDASGTQTGGMVRVGGDYQGTGDLATAQTTNVAKGALIRVNATESGNAGKAIVWSDDYTNFAGTIDATGGARSGNGGFVEVSGHNRLDYTGTTDLRAANGQSGTLLLDPRNVTIAATGATPTLPASGATSFDPSAIDSVLQVSTLQAALALGNVIVTTNGAGTQAGDITVASNISWSNPTDLTLSANRNIIINDGVTVSGLNLILRADSTGSGVGTVSFNGTAKAIASGGVVKIFYNPTSYTSPTNFSGAFANDSAGRVTLSLVHMLVNNLTQLQAINTNLSGTYALGRDIDASASASNPFKPIHNFVTDNASTISFSGIFDGQGNTISNLNVGVDTGGYAGLFGSNIGTIRNVNLTNETISIPNPLRGLAVGGIAGSNGGLTDPPVIGTISNSTVSVTVNIGNLPTDAFALVGGIAGAVQHRSSINDSSAAVNITVGTQSNHLTDTVGGVVGIGTGSVNRSFATGSITGNGGYMGGISGSSYFAGGIFDSYSTVSLTNNNGRYVSALVANIEGSTVTSSYATGKVTVTGTPPIRLGGAVALYNGGSVSNLYWDIQTTGLATSTLGTGLTTALLKAGLPAGFDPAVWAIDPAFNNGYPYLKWQRPSAIAGPTVVAFGVVSVTPTPVPTPTPTPVPVPTPTPVPVPITTPRPIASTPAGMVAVVQTDRSGTIGPMYGPAVPIVRPIVRPGYRDDGSKIDLWVGGLTQADAAGAALDYAYLANAAYGAPGDVSTGFSEWKLERSWYGILNEGRGSSMTPEQYARLERAIASSGFSATLYKKDGKYVLAFRGTEGVNFPDLATDLNQILGFKSGGQYEFAKLIGDLVTQKYGSSNVTFTGHSLGGGLAQYASATNSSHPNAVTFNAAGIGGLSRLMLEPRAEIVNMKVAGEPVSFFGKQLGGQTFEYASELNNLTALEKVSLLPLVYKALYDHVGTGGAEISIRSLFNSWLSKNTP
jgi:filamentous hemagglutinin family protein